MIHTKLGLIFPQGSIKPEGQEQMLRDAGALRLVTVKQSWRSLFRGVRDIREGDTVLFVALSFVPTNRGGDELAPSVQAAEFVHEIERAGAVGIEVYTGRSTAKTDERRAMVREAAAALRNGPRRPPAGFKKRGAPAFVFPPGKEAVWRRIWKSKDYATRKEALEAITEDNGGKRPFGLVKAHELFKQSGRSPGPRKRESK